MYFLYPGTDGPNVYIKPYAVINLSRAFIHLFSALVWNLFNLKEVK